MVRYKSRGILNGIDTEVWDPAVDKMLEKNIRLKTLRKANNRIKVLCTLFNLDPTKPLFFYRAIIRRKGAIYCHRHQL
jgi:starch synthase